MKVLSISIVSLTILFSVSCGSKSREQDQKVQGSNYINISDDSQFFSLLNLNFPGMGEVKKYYKKGDLVKAKIAYLDFRRNISKAKWFINPLEKPKAPVAYNTEAADRIMKHYVRMGSYDGKEVFLGDDINWDTNPLKPSDPDYDTQFSHSLHRLAFWNVLGQAYWATLDEKYAKEWVYQMTDWVKDNPVDLKSGPGSGPFAWWSLNPGIRMSNRGSWMNAYYYFLFSPHLTPDSHFTLVKSVIEHGWRLREVTVKHPEHVGNWVTMECNGLGTIGILFPELKESKEFVKVALDRMSKEIDEQVYPDGSQVELAPGYHQVSMVNFMDLAKLAKMNNITLPKGFLERLRKMYEFNLYLMDPSGYLPPFNDSGRSRITSSLKEAYDVWNDNKFLFGASLGKEGQKPEFDSYFFNYAGYYVMRSGWNYNDNCLFFDAGPVGLAHQHEDMLNLYLYSRGKILLTEPGTYSYDQSEWRRYVLSTTAHNTIIVDGKEQHRSDVPSSRLIKEPLKNPWLTSPLFDYGSGTYSSGYQATQYVPVQYMPNKYVGEKDTSIIHTRHVIFLKPWYYIAVDFLEGKGQHTYDAHFHLDAPDAKINKTTLAVNTLRIDSVQLGLFPMDVEGLKVKIVKGQKDPILGWLPREKRQIPTIVYSEKKEAPATFSTLIYPYLLKEPEVNYRKIMAGNKNLWGENINTPYESVSLIIRRNKEKTDLKVETMLVPPFSVNADVILIRKPKDKKDFYFGFYNISNYKEETLAFDLTVPSSVLILKRDNKVLFYNPQEGGVEITFTVPVAQKVILSSKKWAEIKSSGVNETLETFSLN
jgi:Heparinase II/III N-terminus/Heparinase II/III-like protein